MALAAAPDLPGFHALSQLGTGPSSSIFSAQSENLGRWVALSIYTSSGRPSGHRSGRPGSEPEADRFRRGFELTRRLGVHPHAVTLLDWGLTPDGRPYIVTEFYEHGTFDTRVTGNQPLPVDKTLRIGIQVAGALETAHRAGVIHGGVHPARILADSDDEPSLADLGLVPLVDPSGPDALLGPTNYHAPPEVLEGDELTPATDVYSLASTLHTLLTTRPPYRAEAEETAAALLLRVLHHEFTPLTRADAPPVLVQALRAALHPDPRQRPASVLAFAQSLQSVQQEIGVPVTQPVLLDVAQELAGAGDVAARSSAPLPPPLAAPPTAGPPGTYAGSPVIPPWARPQTPPEAPPTQESRLPPIEEPPVPAAPEPQVSPAVPPADKAFVPYPMPEAEPGPVGSKAETAGRAPATRTEPADASRPPLSGDSAPVTALPAEARSDPDDVLALPNARTRLIARGPKALPVIVLGAIVAALIIGAIWMVLSGSDASDATTTDDDTEQTG